MTRKEELLELVNNDIRFVKLIDEMVYHEEELGRLKKLPMLKINPKNHEQQKITPAAHLYNKILAQYQNEIRILMKATGTSEDDSESPFRAWLKEHLN